MFGLFAEMGPFSATANLTLQGRNTTWNKDYGMIFIDNPVGAGFSYTLEDAGGVASAHSCVSGWRV